MFKEKKKYWSNRKMVGDSTTIDDGKQGVEERRKQANLWSAVAAGLVGESIGPDTWLNQVHLID
jgi:hypothetical protein